MKNSVTVDELNAAVLLMTGGTLNDLFQLTIVPGMVTAIYVNEETGTEEIRRVRIEAQLPEELTDDSEESDES